MSNKTKRIAKGLGASALAVATIASGLSFGAASASAASTTAETSGVFAKMFWNSDAQSVNGRWNAVVRDGQGSNTNYIEMFPQGRRAAEAAALEVSVPNPSGWTQMQLKDTNYCLSVATVRSLRVFNFVTCDPLTDDQRFRMDELGRIVVQSTREWIVGTTDDNGASIFSRGTSEPKLQFEGPWAGKNLTASAAFDSALNKPVQFSGTAAENADIIIRDNGGKTVASARADADGDWAVEMPAPDIEGSLYTVWIDQVVNGSTYGHVKIDLEYGAAVAITGPEDQEDVPAGATAITGTGENGSTVQVFDNDGRNPVISTTVRANGTWSGAANLSAGEHKLEAKQLSKGARITTSTITVNPGDSALTAATVTTDAYTPGQRTTFAGTATAGATVDVLAADGTVIAGGVQVAANGSFSFQATPAAGSTQYAFSVRQTLGSDTRTDGPFTIDATVDAFAPVTVTRPATVTPGVENVFTGTATPGATYRVLNASGTQIVPGTFTIDAQGNWTFRRMVSTGATKLDFKLEQTLNGETRTSQLFSIRANAGYAVANTTRSVRPGATNTFTGTGPAGASYRVLNMSGTQIVPGTFDIDAQGNWTFDRVVSLGAANFKFKLEVTTADGATFTTPLYTVNAASLTPATVSTTEVFPGRQNTFTGKGEPGATFSVLNMSDTVLDPSIESTFRVDANGNWEFKRVVSSGAANFKFKIRQTLNGQTTTSDLFTIDAATFQAATVDNEYVNAGIWNTFTGTVTPGATMRVLNTSNNELSGITDLQVAADGTYSFKRIVSATGTKLDFRIEQTHDGKTMIGDTVTLQARTADVTIDNTSVTPGRVNTFTGTATPGATFEVFTPGNVGDTPLASGTVSAQGRFTFDRTVGTGATSYAFKIVLTKDGKQSVSAPITIAASSR